MKFTEKWTEHIDFSIDVKEHLWSEQTAFQQMKIYQSYDLGRFFTLDGILMITEKDEFIYHEMIVHTPMSVNPSIERVLVIGGGDGGSVRELVKYPSIKKIDMVEIDGRVVELCKQFFPNVSSGYSDPRVNLTVGDGKEYVHQCKEKYDLIIVDSTDPIGPGEGLFTKAFYQECFHLLTDDGILINQHESPYFEKESLEMKRAHEKIKNLFPIALVYQAFIPTYPSGHWLFGFASKKLHPIEDFKDTLIHSLGYTTKYYNKELHTACFALPNYVKQQLK